MQLAYHDTLGTVDDKLTTTKHDWDVAQEHFLFNRLLFFKSQPDAERLSVSQPQLTTLFGRITWFTKLVSNVAQLQFFVVALNWKDFLKHSLNSVKLSLFRRKVGLKESLIAVSLNLGQIRRNLIISTATKHTNIIRC